MDKKLAILAMIAGAAALLLQSLGPSAPHHSGLQAGSLQASETVADPAGFVNSTGPGPVNGLAPSLFKDENGNPIGLIAQTVAEWDSLKAQSPSHSIPDDFPDYMDARSEVEKCAKKFRVKFILDDAMSVATQWSDEPHHLWSEMTKAVRKSLQFGTWPLHIYGPSPGCNVDYYGAGTAVAVQSYKPLNVDVKNIVWLTVDHNVNTEKYFDLVARWWDVQGFALIPRSCDKDRSCVLESGTIPNVVPLDDLYNIDLKLNVTGGELFLNYGCSLFVDRNAATRTIYVKTFCMGNQGTLAMRGDVSTMLSGGDLCLLMPVMPGYSGSPLFQWDGSTKPMPTIRLISTVNSGYPGLITCTWKYPKDLLERLKPPPPPEQPSTAPPPPPDEKPKAAAKFRNHEKLDESSRKLWEKAYTANEDYQYVKDDKPWLTFQAQSILIHIEPTPEALSDFSTGKYQKGKLQDWAKVMGNWEVRTIQGGGK